MLSATWYYSTKETSLKFGDCISIAAILHSPAHLTGSTKNAVLKRGHQLPGGQKFWPDLWVGTHAVSSEKTDASGDHPALEPRSTRPPKRPADTLRSASAHPVPPSLLAHYVSASLCLCTASVAICLGFVTPLPGHRTQQSKDLVGSVSQTRSPACCGCSH